MKHLFKKREALWSWPTKWHNHSSFREERRKEERRLRVRETPQTDQNGRHKKQRKSWQLSGELWYSREPLCGRPRKSKPKDEINERLAAQFCFLSTEKRNELIEKLGNKYMNLSSSTQMNTNATNTNTNANNTINTTYTTKSSSTSNERKRSKRMKRAGDSLLELVRRT